MTESEAVHINWLFASFISRSVGHSEVSLVKNCVDRIKLSVGEMSVCLI